MATFILSCFNKYSLYWRKWGEGERREACFCGPLRWLSLNQQLASKPQGHQKRKQNQRTEAVAN